MPIFPIRRSLHDALCALGLHTDTGSWVVPDAVLACAYPRSDAALAALAARGVGLVVNLHERAHAPAALARHGLVEVHLPTPDFTPPSPEQLRRGVDAIEAALRDGRRVVAHCKGGRGRAGTLLACLLVARGASPDAAIAEVRRRRPGAIETAAQEAAVAAFAEGGGL
jgi:atypical dual specificity phosphatase